MGLEALLDEGVEQGLEPHGVARPCLERPVVFPEHRAEGHMHEIDPVEAGQSPATCRLEELLEVLPLPVIDHIQDAVGLPMLHPPLDRGQIGGGVEEGPVGLPDQKRRLVFTA